MAAHTRWRLRSKGIVRSNTPEIPYKNSARRRLVRDNTREGSYINSAHRCNVRDNPPEVPYIESARRCIVRDNTQEGSYIDSTRRCNGRDNTLRFLESAERTPAHSVRQRHSAPFCSQIHSTFRSVRLMFLDLVPNALIRHDANLLASIQLVEATQIHFAVEQRFDVWVESLPISICITKLRVSGWTR